MANSNGAPTAATSSDVSSKEDRREETRNLIKAGFENKTKGETLFNRIVYGGLGFGLVTGVSIFTTWLLRDSKLLSSHYSNLIKTVQNTFKGNRTGAALEKFNNSVDSAMTIGALFTGGTIATVLPVKAMEDNKASIVKALDRRIYGADVVATNPDIIAAHHELDIAPKQSWASVLVSRIVAFAGTFATWFVVGGAIDKGSIQAGRSIDKFFRAKDSPVAKEIAHMQSISPREMHRKLNPEKPRIDAVDRVSTRLWNYVVQDGLYTALTSTLLFVSTRIFGPIFDKSHLSTPSKQDATTVEKPPHSVENSLSFPARQSKHLKASDSASLHDSQDSASRTEQPLTKVSAVSHKAMQHTLCASNLAQNV